LNQKLLKMDWGLCYESLIQSSIELQRPVTLLPLSDPAARQAVLASDSLFVTPWTEFSLKKVNQAAYWQLPEQAYVLPDQ
jgi:hypothetical protein